MGQIVGIAIVWFIIEMLLWYLLAPVSYTHLTLPTSDLV